MPTNLSILIFVASPLDYARYRQAALYFEFESYARDAETGTEVAVETPSHLRSSLMEAVRSPAGAGFGFSERLDSDLPVSEESKSSIGFTAYPMFLFFPLVLEMT